MILKDSILRYFLIHNFIRISYLYFVVLVFDVIFVKVVILKIYLHHFYRSSDAFVRVTLQHSNELALVSVIVGWIYFVAWSISFYPQMYENWQRKR